MYIVTLNVVFVVRVSRHFQHAGNKLLSSRYIKPHILKRVYILHVCILTQIVCVVRVNRYFCYQNKLVNCITSSILVKIWCQVILTCATEIVKAVYLYVCVSIYLHTYRYQHNITVSPQKLSAMSSNCTISKKQELNCIMFRLDLTEPSKKSQRHTHTRINTFL